MTEKRIWAQKLQAIKSSAANFKIAAEIWDLFGKDARSMAAVNDVGLFFHCMLVFFDLTPSKQKSEDYLNEKIYLTQLCQHEAFGAEPSLGNIFSVAAEQPDKPWRGATAQDDIVKPGVLFIDYDTFFDILSAVYIELVIHSAPSLFRVFWEYVYISVVEIKDGASNVLLGTTTAECQSSAVIKDEAAFSCFYFSETKNFERLYIYASQSPLGLTRTVRQPERVLGKPTQEYLDLLANSAFSAPPSNRHVREIKETLMAEEKFYTFFCLVDGGECLHLNLAVRKAHKFERVKVAKSNEFMFKDLLNEEFYEKIDYIERFTRLFNNQKNPYCVEQAKSLGFESEASSISERLLKANKLGFKTLANFKNNENSQVNPNQSNPCLVYTNKIEGIENELNRRDVTLERLGGELCGDWVRDRLLQLSQDKPLRILVLGNRFTEKSSIAKVLSKILNVDLIDIDALVETEVQSLEARAIEFAEAQNEYHSSFDNETGVYQQPPPKEPRGLQELISLKDGGSLSESFLQQIFHNKINELKTQHKGYVIEFSSVMFGQNFLGPLLKTATDSHRIIEYIIDLKMSDDACARRSKELFEMLKASDEARPKMLYTNKFAIKERELQAKRAEFLKNGADMTEAQTEVYEKISSDLREYLESPDNFSAYPRADLYKGVTRNDAAEADQRFQYNCFDLSDLKDYAIQNQAIYLAIESEGKAPGSIIMNILKKIGYQKFKAVGEIEGASNLASLLEADRNLESGDPRRMWSFYKNIDCVEMVDNGLVALGLPEFAVDYHNFVFIFSSAENKTKFIKNPQNYLKDFPSIKGKINLAVLTPTSPLVKQITEEIASQYNLKIIDLGAFLAKLLAMLDENQGKIDGRAFWSIEDYYLNIQDILTSVKAGSSFSSLDLLKLCLLHNGFELELRFDGDIELKNILDRADPKFKKKVFKKEQKAVDLSLLVTKSENFKLRSEFYERIRTSDEVSQDVLSQLPEPSTFTAPLIQPRKGFIFYNSLLSPKEIELLQGFGIQLDKVISFWGKINDEDRRLPFDEGLLNLEKTSEQLADLQEYIKSNVANDCLLDIDFTEKNGPFLKTMIIDFVDPFKEKIDGEDSKVNFDFSNVDSGKELLVYGKFGRLCPVSLLDKGWFYFANPANFNLQIENRLYCFATEAHKEKFQRAYNDYIQNLNALNVNSFAEDNCRVFMIGAIGSGLRSMSKHMCHLTGLGHLDLKSELIRAKKQFIKEKMLLATYLSGFSSENFEEKEAIISGLERDDPQAYSKYEPADPEAEKQFELDQLQRLIIEGTKKVIMVELYLTEEEQIIFKGNLKEMIASLNLVPDHLIVLKSGEYIALHRLLHTDKEKELLRQKLESIRHGNKARIEERRQELFREKLEEDKKTLLEEVEVNEDELNLEQEFDIEEELGKLRANIINRREAQLELIKDFIDQFKEPETELFHINTELPMVKITNILNQLSKAVNSKRSLHFHQTRLTTVNDFQDNLEVSCDARLDKLIKAGAYRLSEFGKRNCLKPEQLLSRFEHNFLHNGQIYFVSSQQELDYIRANPATLNELKPAFNKRLLMPKVMFLRPIADPSLKGAIERKSGLKITTLKSIVENLFYKDDPLSFLNSRSTFLDVKLSGLSPAELEIPELFGCSSHRDTDAKHRDIKNTILKGHPLSDVQKVYLIYSFIKESEENEKGYIIEDFPETRNQLELLSALKCLPHLVFTSPYSENDLKAIVSKEHPLFNHSDRFKQLLEYKLKDIQEIEQYFSTNFKNLFTLNFEKPWTGNFELINNLIESQLLSLRQAMRGVSENRAYGLGLLPISKRFIEQNLLLESRLSISQRLNRGLNVVCPFSYNLVQFLDGKYFFDCKTVQIIKKSIKDQKALAHQEHKNGERECPVVDFPSTLIDPSKPLNLHPNFNGCCPVCYSKNIIKDGLESLRLVVKTDNCVLFCSLPHLHEFFVCPKLFLARSIDGKRLEVEREAKTSVVDIQKKLMDEVALIMNHVCQMKLKHPGLTIKQSALVLTAILLKVRNPLKSVGFRSKYELRLHRFIKACKEAKTISQQLAIDFKIPTSYEKENLSVQINRLLKDLDQLRVLGNREYLNQFMF